MQGCTVSFKGLQCIEVQIEDAERFFYYHFWDKRTHLFLKKESFNLGNRDFQFHRQITTLLGKEKSSEKESDEEESNNTKTMLCLKVLLDTDVLHYVYSFRIFYYLLL